MIGYRDWFFIILAALAILFMLWVLFKFQEELSGRKKSAKQAEADPARVRIVPARLGEGERTPARNL